MMEISGRACSLGDNIDTDLIIPGKYLAIHDPEELKDHCFELLGETFKKKLLPGDILVAGKNFGCGSSREHAPIAIKAAGISVVIAESFASIFARNAINVGLPVIELEGCLTKIREGDVLDVDITQGKVRNQTTHKMYVVRPYPTIIRKILQAGGLMQLLVETVHPQRNKES